MMRTLASGVHGVVDATNKFTWTAEVLRRKGTAQPLSEKESTLTLAWTGFYCCPVTLHQRRFSFIILRFTLSDYFLQITTKKLLQMQGNDKSDWSGYILFLGWLSTDFRELLQRYTLNICDLNSGWGSSSKSKPWSSLGTIQAWFPMETSICRPGSCVPPHTHWFF